MNVDPKRFGLVLYLFIAFLCSFLLSPPRCTATWPKDAHFRLAEVNGRPCLVAPDGKPFKSVGMVWAYGPEEGPYKREVTLEGIIEELETMLSLGFNTLNLYGDRFIPDMLDWCDAHEMAVYFRTEYYYLPEFPSTLREYPDYMDPAFREMVMTGFDSFLAQVKDHPSVLAIDMDHRWLFPLDWSGAQRRDQPQLRTHAVAFFPKWLRNRYHTIDLLNAAWATAYESFEAILQDETLLTGGVFQKLGCHPARVDVVRYTLWTAVDFLTELTAYMHERAPGVMITPTTEHPECLPEINPGKASGIAFMSPVHYNGKDDYTRDLPSLCKLIYETRWHYDMQGAPVYISETGWRTTELQQDPPNRDYAWMVPPTEDVATDAYLRQFSVLNLLPWVSGYGWFKWYDKWPEGDFGYVRDDGTQKPITKVGLAINQAFDVADMPDVEPEIWIYYPEAAQASHRPGFQQLKTLVYILEKDFLDALDLRMEEYGEKMRLGDAESGQDFADALTADFCHLWKGFSFTREIPTDDKPVLLLSTISEMLSPEERLALMSKKTISVGPVGVRDLIMSKTSGWHLQVLGLSEKDVCESVALLNVTNGVVTPLQVPKEERETNEVPAWCSQVPADAWRHPMKCKGQSVSVAPGPVKQLNVIAGSVQGNAAPFFHLVYEDGSRSKVTMGPTISDMRYMPLMSEEWPLGKRHLSLIEIPVEPRKTLVKIEWPEAPWVYLFSALFVSGGEAGDVQICLKGPLGEVQGQTDWWLSLSSAVQHQCEEAGALILQKNAAGDPVLMARGRHVTFLYDVLNWGSGTNEISAFIDFHKATFDHVFDYLDGEFLDE